MVSGELRPMVRVLLLSLLAAVTVFCGVGRAGEYQGISPGVSRKNDVEKQLGSSAKEVLKDVQYDYTPPADDIRRLSVVFSREEGIVERIDIYLRDTYTKEQFREWFAIGEADKREQGAYGNLIEYYAAEGIILHFTDSDDGAPVEFFSHYAHVATQTNTKETEQLSENLQQASPAVLLSDDFDLENKGQGTLNYFSFQQWDVLNGTVDMIGNGFWDFYPGRGLYVDLDGSLQKAAALVSKKRFSLELGEYQLLFDLAGSPLSGPNTVTVQLGSVYGEEFTLAAKAPFTTVVRDISVLSPVDAKLSFHHLGGDNEGLLLDNVQLIKIQ